MGADQPDYYWSKWKLAYCCKLKPIDGCPENIDDLALVSGDSMRLYDQRQLHHAGPRPGLASAAGAFPALAALCGVGLLGLAAALAAGRSARALLGAGAERRDRRRPEPDEDLEPEGLHSLLTGPSQ